MPVIVPRKYEDMQRDFFQEISRLADLAWTKYMQNPYQSLYLVGKKKAGLDTHYPFTLIWAELSIEDEYAEGWTPVRPERLSPAWPIEVMRDEVKKALHREPLWIFAD